MDYGLYRRCETRLVVEPYHATDPKPSNSTISPPLHNVMTAAYICTPFPPRSVCEREGEGFCIAWSSAGYLSQLGLVLVMVALFTLMIVNIVSSRARRRNAWRFVSFLVGLHATVQIVALGLVTGMSEKYAKYFSSGAHFNISYWFNVTTCVLDTFVIIGLVVTGIYAEKGHRWAAGRRPYHPIPG
ncbi:uncharacterized protein EI90DRAFT_3014497 [Cantharellus anzutake]|uniref:uncharacterized protein n=1 Tax=Cantharellus anzutake TaxID=1750568 RepID=UPI001905F02B|nr:uncharacterized protein EI90DRAFT_3014497 [Cantharellus anzutake]KAF8335902.1 hypothetical protein EI90DRAFT_3014497 [Cantharellus anzutake]